jgi:hypothetical protein
MTDAELTLDALERMGGKQVTFYVGPGGNDGNSGRSWKDRLETTAEGIRRAWAGDRVVCSTHTKDIGWLTPSIP